MAKISPFAPQALTELPVVDGVRLAACAAGIRHPGRTDLLLALFEPATTVAGVLTTSKTASAAVEWCRAHLKHGMARALVVNSGNANAFTGLRGREAVVRTAHEAADVAECLEADVYIASTGVIGEPLDPDKFVGLLSDLARDAAPDAYEAAARAIMTTDTYPKLATGKCEIDGVEITINGIAKGAGMIAPDM
ncbi:MAG: bifunctional ornithine acetyltransferase/N-acetylglutamate synthase, partial [Methyloceanibacter sp.]